MDKIFRIILDFPHGITMDEGQAIANEACIPALAGISEGGMQIIGNTPDGEGLVFCKHTMQFVYGHSCINRQNGLQNELKN